MRSRSRYLALALVASSSWACVGGGGGTGDLPSGYEPLAGELERPGTSGRAPIDYEAPGRDVERPSTTTGGGSPTTGSGGGTGVPCSGSYRCTTTIEGRAQSSNISLAASDGNCVATDADGDKIPLGPTSSLTPSGEGFTVEVQGIRVTCVPR